MASMGKPQTAVADEQTYSVRIKRLFHQVMALGITLIVFLVIIAAFWMFRLDRLVEQLELKSYDFRSQLQWGSNPKKRPSQDIVILTFDDSSLNLLSDEFGQWPWPRDVHAEMIQYLNRIGAKRMIYDIMFIARRKGGEQEDAKFIQAFQDSRNVYLSMNLDHELTQTQSLGKDLSPRDIEMLKPLSITVVSQLDKAPQDTILKLKKDADGNVFFNNDHMTFNHYRSIMPELLAVGRNIGVINHGSDEDGVSRSNPLFFRFVYQGFIKTAAFPLHERNGRFYDQQGYQTDDSGYKYEKSRFLPIVATTDKTGKRHYVDQNPDFPQPVDEEGYLKDGHEHPIYLREGHLSTLYFPYLGLKATLDATLPNHKPVLTITPEGTLKFANMEIPLLPNGDCPATWYNVNLTREAQQKAQSELKSMQTAMTANINTLNRELSTLPGKNSPARVKLQKQLALQQEELQKLMGLDRYVKEALDKDYVPQPYDMIPVWQVVSAMHRVKAGLPPSQDDIKLIAKLKGKTIFLGATAVAAYDLKNTSLQASMPGVILQATLYDNLSRMDQNQFIQRVKPIANIWLSVLLCIVAITTNLRIRSTLVGVLTTANLMVIHVLLAIALFQYYNIWIDIAMPVLGLILATTFSFMAKYMMRNQDYEKTYALATTDSMTGLYNHRFFQDSMRQFIENSKRFNQPFSLILIDIDHFKKFNDTHGHQAGDEVLRHVARKLKKSVRAIDVVARYGGEEMAIIVARAGQDEAVIVAQKIVEAIAEEAYPIAEGVSKHVTISCGVSTYPKHGSTPAELIEISDGGLYRAKENGRNQVGALPPEVGQGDLQPPTVAP